MSAVYILVGCYNDGVVGAICELTLIALSFDMRQGANIWHHK